MREVKIAQLERSDLYRIREFFNYGFRHLLDYYIPFSKLDIEKWYDDLGDNSKVFAIRGSEDVYKDFIVGLGGFLHIDWISRHAEIMFMMIDKGGPKVTLHNTELSKAAFKQLLDLGFSNYNLNKVYINMHENNDIKLVLEESGFVAEGIRRQAIFKGGQFMDSIVFSLLLSEYKAKK